MTTRTIRGILCAAAVALAGCGSDSPTAPSPVTLPTIPSVAGSWTGNYTVRLDGVAVGATTITATFTQDGGLVTGTWSASAFDSRGTFTGTITGTGFDARFAGTFAINAPSDDPAIRCDGTAEIAGNALTPLVWTADRVTVAPSCSGELTDLRITLSRSATVNTQP